MSEELATEDGQVQRHLFSSDDLRRLDFSIENAHRLKDRQVSLPPDQRSAESPCVVTVAHDHRMPPPGETLEELVEAATGIYLGEVVAQRSGLLRGLPRVLLRIEVERALTHRAASTVPETLLLPFPDVKVHIAGACLEARSHRKGGPPDVGSRVLFFSPARGGVPSGGLLALEPEEIFFENASGTVSLPAHFGDLSSGEDDLSFQAIVEQVERLIDQSIDPG